MATYKSNSIVLTNKEVKIYTEKMKNVTAPQGFIEVLEEIFSLADFELQMSWAPVYKDVIVNYKIRPCYTGRVSGINIDKTGKGRCVYSLSIHGAKSNYYVLGTFYRTGSGGGGEKWSYDSLHLFIEEFPLMVEAHQELVNNANFKDAQYRLNTRYIELLENAERAIDIEYGTKHRASPELLVLRNVKSELDEFYKKFTESIKTKTIIAENEIKSTIKVEIPKPVNLEDSMSKYQKVRTKLYNIYTNQSILTKESGLEEQYKAMQIKYAELMI